MHSLLSRQGAHTSAARRKTQRLQWAEAQVERSNGPLHLHVWNAWLAELVDAADAFLEDPEGNFKAAQLARDEMDPQTLAQFQECMTQVNGKTNQLKISQCKTFWEETPN